MPDFNPLSPTTNYSFKMCRDLSHFVIAPNYVFDMKAIAADNLFISHILPCGCNAKNCQIKSDDARMHQPFILQDDIQMNASTIIVPYHT